MINEEIEQIKYMVEQLRPHHIELLHQLSLGLSREDAAKICGIQLNTMRTYINEINKILETKTIEETLTAADRYEVIPPFIGADRFTNQPY